MLPLRRGNQEPTFSTVRDWAYSDGDYAVDMFLEYGATFYECQEFELKVYLARNDDGSYAALTICVSKPRQNGKSYAARFYAVWMAAIEGKNVLFSAHNGDTVRKMFKAVRDFVEGTPDFACMLKPNGQGIYAAKGSEGIYFVDEDGRDAGLIEFQTRTNGKARGTTYQIIIVDEAQELTDEHLEAIKPTTFAASDVADADSDPQMIYLGTPPNTKCPGTVFRDFHDRAHDDPDSSIWWMEWAVDEVPDLSDREAAMELVYLTNPAMGYRIKERTMLDAMDTMRADSFARECLGWWTKVATSLSHLVSRKDWASCATREAPGSGDVAYAVKFDPGGTEAAIAVCSVADGRPPHVELVEARSLSGGMGWVTDFVADVAGFAMAIAVDGKGSSQTLVERAERAGVDTDVIRLPNASEAMAAYSSFVDAAREHALTHFDQAELNDSVCGSTRRRIGGAGAFGFQSTENADATLAEACALAYWCAMSTRRNPQQELRMG